MLRRSDLLSLAVGAAALAALLWAFGADEIATAFCRADPRLLVLYLWVSALILLGYALRWQMVCRSLGSSMPLRHLIAARLGGDAVGAAIPSAKLAGEPVRVALMRTAGADTARAGAAVTLDRVLEIIGNVLYGLAAVTCFALAGGGGNASLMLAAGMTAALAFLAVPLWRLRRGGRPLAFIYGSKRAQRQPFLAAVAGVLRGVEEHLSRFFREQPRVFVWGLLGSLAIEALNVLQYGVLLRAFGVTLSLPLLLMVVISSGVARAAPTPSGLGAMEATEVALFTASTGDPRAGLLVGAVLRVHETVWMAIGFAVLWHYGVSLGSLRLSAAEKAAA